MARSEKHWQKIEAHLKKWAAELDRARVGAEAEVAKVQTQYYQRMAELQTEIEQSLKRWDAELKALKQRAGTAESEVARGIDEFRARLQAQITEWQPEFEQLKAKAAKAQAEAKRLTQEVRAQGKAATKRLTALRRTAGESWDEIKPAIERAWAELPALRSAAARFREAPQDVRAASGDSTDGPREGLCLTTHACPKNQLGALPQNRPLIGCLKKEVGALAYTMWSRETARPMVPHARQRSSGSRLTFTIRAIRAR